VVESVQVEFGVTLARSHIQQYDPTKRAGKDLGKKFVELFNSTRKTFLESISEIPIAHQSFRLKALQRSYDWFVAKNNYIAANQVLEQSAKEAGNFYANNTKPGDDADHQLHALYKQISGNSISVVHIEENLPKLKPSDNVIGEFGEYWIKHKQKAFEALCHDEQIQPEQLQKLLQTYEFASRLPRPQEIKDALSYQPKVLERKTILGRVAEKIQAFIDTFVEGMGGSV